MALGMTVVTTAFLAAPARVWGATIASVDFPAEDIPTQAVMSWPAGGLGTVGSLCRFDTKNADGSPRGTNVTWGGSNVESGGARCWINGADTFLDFYTVKPSWMVEGLQLRLTTNSAMPSNDQNAFAGWKFQWHRQPQGQAAALIREDFAQFATSTAFGVRVFDIPAAPALTDSLKIVAFNSTFIESWSLEIVGEAEGGDCQGVGTMAGGSTIFHVDGGDDWGVMWGTWPGLGGVCLGSLSPTPTAVRWMPGVPIMVPGAIYCLESEWADAGAIKVYALDSGGGAGQQVAGYNTAPSVATVRTVCWVAESFGYGLRWEYPGGVYNGGQLLRDGTDEDLAAYPDGKQPVRVHKGLTDYFADCEVPVADIDVPVLSDLLSFLFGGTGSLSNPVDYIPYGICLMVGGFRTVGDFLGDVIGAIRDLALTAFDVTATAIGAAFEAVLTTLFEPQTLGDDWQAFVDLLATKAPTGWAIQVVGYLSSMVTAGNLAGGALPNLSTPWGTVSLQTAPITESFEDYRPVGVALVGVAFAVGLMRKTQSVLGGGSA